MRNLEVEDLTIEIKCEPESTPIAGNYLATGDDQEDYRAERRLKRQLMDNEWAWCEVTINCEYKGISATEHLGCCSYDSEKDFKSGVYYDDMVESCLSQIQYHIDEISQDLNND